MSQLTIRDFETASKYPEFLVACVARAARFGDFTVEISPSERLKDGWLEWSMRISTIPASKLPCLFIGCIQRRPGALPEFHS